MDEEIWKGEKEYWAGRRLIEEPAYNCRWVSNESWVEVPTREKARVLLSRFLKADDKLVSYSCFDEAIDRLKKSPLLKRLGAGHKYYNERYIFVDVAVTY